MTTSFRKIFRVRDEIYNKFILRYTTVGVLFLLELTAKTVRAMLADSWLPAKRVY